MTMETNREEQKRKTEKVRKLKNIDIKVAKKIHKQLLKDVTKAHEKLMFNYDLDAFGEFCADVVFRMDVMIGQTVDKLTKP